MGEEEESKGPLEDDPTYKCVAPTPWYPHLVHVVPTRGTYL